MSNDHDRDVDAWKIVATLPPRAWQEGLYGKLAVLRAGMDGRPPEPMIVADGLPFCPYTAERGRGVALCWRGTGAGRRAALEERIADTVRAHGREFDLRWEDTAG